MKDFDSRITRLKEQLRELKEGHSFRGIARQCKLIKREIKKARISYERRTNVSIT